MKMIGAEMGFWSCSRLSRLKLIRVLRGAVELGPAQGELKSNSLGGRQLNRGLAAPHEDGYSQLSRELG